MKLLAFETCTEACSVALWLDGELRERYAVAPRQHAELSLPWAEALLAEAGIAKSQLDAIAVGRGPGAFTGVRLGISLAQGVALALDRPVLAVSTLAALAMRAAPLAGRHADHAGAAHHGASADGAERNDAERNDGDNAHADARHREAERDEGGRAAGDTTAGADASVRVLAAIDARMSELYVGQFALRDGDAVALCDETLAVPDTVALLAGGEGGYGVGTGFAALDGALRARLSPRLRAIDAEALPRAGDIARLALRAYARGEALAPEHVEPAYLRNHVALTLAEQAAAKRP